MKASNGATRFFKLEGVGFIASDKKSTRERIEARRQDQDLWPRECPIAFLGKRIISFCSEYSWTHQL